MTSRDWCLARISLDLEVASTILALEGAAWEYTLAGVMRAPWPCEQVVGHTGPHLVHVHRTSDNREFWLRWQAAEGPEVISAPACAGEFKLNGSDPLYCLLLDGHDGPHYALDREWT